MLDLRESKLAIWFYCNSAQILHINFLLKILQNHFFFFFLIRHSLKLRLIIYFGDSNANDLAIQKTDIIAHSR